MYRCSFTAVAALLITGCSSGPTWLYDGQPADESQLTKAKLDCNWYFKLNKHDSREQFISKIRETRSCMVEKGYSLKDGDKNLLLIKKHTKYYNESITLLSIESKPIYSNEVESCHQLIDTSKYYSPLEYRNLLNWHINSKEANRPACINNIGWVYHAIDRDYVNAIKWYKDASSQGDLDATYNLAVVYDNPSSSYGNYKKAFSLYRLASEQNHKHAQNNLAQMYMNGHGTPRDFAKARLWFEKSAKQGYSVALVQLGHLYEQGYGVDQSYETSVNYYKQAVNLGDDTGELRLAHLYLEGLGVTADKNKAISLLQSSASKGNSYAEHQLSLVTN